MMVKIKIENREQWNDIYRELRKAGLLDGLTSDEVNRSEDKFPMEIPLDIEPLLKLVQSPLVKPFKKKMDTCFTKHVRIVLQQD